MPVSTAKIRLAQVAAEALIAATENFAYDGERHEKAAFTHAKAAKRSLERALEARA